MTHIGIKCNAEGCPTPTFSGPGAFNEWESHRKQTGHEDHSWTNTFSKKGIEEFNAPYSHPSGRF